MTAATATVNARVMREKVVITSSEVDGDNDRVLVSAFGDVLPACHSPVDGERSRIAGGRHAAVHAIGGSVSPADGVAGVLEEVVGQKGARAAAHTANTWRSAGAVVDADLDHGALGARHGDHGLGVKRCGGIRLHRVVLAEVHLRSRDDALSGHGSDDE